MYGIPEFRLPKDIVQKEIDSIRSLGVDIQVNAVIGKSSTVGGGVSRTLSGISVSYTHLDVYKRQR